MKQVEWSGVAVNSATQVTFKWNVSLLMYPNKLNTLILNYLFAA